MEKIGVVLYFLSRLSQLRGYTFDSLNCWTLLRSLSYLFLAGQSAKSVFPFSRFAGASFLTFSLYDLFLSKIIRHGRLGRLHHALSFLHRYLKGWHSVSSRAVFVHFYLHLFYLPFLIGRRTKALRVYVFPLMAPRLKRLQHGFTFLARRVRHARSSFSLKTRLISELVEGFFHYPASDLCAHAQSVVAQGLENRTQMHYRWPRKHR